MPSPAAGGVEAKKKAVVLLRWVLIISCSCLIIFQDQPGATRNIAHLVVLALILSNVLLAAVPARFYGWHGFDHALVTFDILFITSSIYLSGEPDSDLYLLYFLVIMIAAVGETLKAIIWSATLVSAVYLMVLLSFGDMRQVLSPEMLMRVPFFFVVALFYGYFSQLVRSERRKKVEIERELSAATQVREMSIALSRSLDRKTILETLAQSMLALCRVEYCAVISRGGQVISTDAGKAPVSLPQKMCAMLLADLERRVAPEEPENEQRPLVFPASDSQLEFAADKRRQVCLVNDNFTFLPVSGQIDSDLYLCMVGRVSNERLDYAVLLLTAASMALHHAGQYQALVHEAEKRQEMLRQLSAALKFKSEFAANVTHEIRTPIYALIGFGELLLNGGYGALSLEQQQTVGRMLDRAQGLLELVNNILDHAKLESGEYRLRPLYRCVRDFLGEIVETCEPLLKDFPISLHVRCDSAVPECKTDWAILRQVVLNLVSNALKFTQRGRVEISAAYDDSAKLLMLAVSDTGIGIAASKLADIFEPFRQLENSYTKKYAGTGLGLAITKRQVEVLGGKISVSSKAGEGSEFVVTVPVEAAGCENDTAKLVEQPTG